MYECNADFYALLIKSGVLIHLLH